MNPELFPGSGIMVLVPVVLNREWQIVVMILLFEFKGCFCIISDFTCLINTGWIRIRMDPELLPGSGTRKIQSWIRIRNK